MVTAAMAFPGAELDELVGPAGDGYGADPGLSAQPCQVPAGRLLRNVEAILAQWAEYDANRRLPAAQRRELAEPRIEAASLSALSARLRRTSDELRAQRLFG